MWLMILAGLILAVVVIFGLIFLIQEIDAWVWHWWHYSRPLWMERRAWTKRYKDFERRNRW